MRCYRREWAVSGYHVYAGLQNLYAYIEQVSDSSNQAMPETITQACVDSCEAYRDSTASL